MKFVFLFAIFIAGCVSINIGDSPELKEFIIEGEEGNKNKVLLIPVNGQLTTTNEKSFLALNDPINPIARVTLQLKLVKKNNNIKAVILLIDSPGGTVTASDILYNEIKEFTKQTNIPVISLMLNVAASGGYYIAMATDYVIAHPTTITGSVGVIAITTNTEKLLEKLGVEVSVFKTGEFKDAGFPIRNLNLKESELLNKNLATMATRFYGVIKDNRGNKIKDWQTIKSARVMLAGEALELGMIDEIGYISSAYKKAKNLAKINNSSLVIWSRKSTKQYSAYSETLVKKSEVLPQVINQNLLHSGIYYLWLNQ